MSSPEPPGGRLPIGESPRWIGVHALIGFGFLPAVVLIQLMLPAEHHEILRYLLTVSSVLTLANLARLYAQLRNRMSKVETGYLRTALFVIGISGFPGIWHLSAVAGVAFYIWTIVERRQQRKPPTTARERLG